MSSAIDLATRAEQLPFISTSGIFTPAQIQQQVNLIFATADLRTQAETRRLVGDMAGRGFSANSPILAALRVGLQGQGLRSAINNAAQAQLAAAKENAEAIFAAQSKLSDQFLAQEGVLNDVTRINGQIRVGMLSAIASMIAGIA